MSGPAPKVFSSEYYDRLYEIEERHWWAIGMRAIERALLARTLATGPLDILDAGCGCGAMLDFFAAMRPESRLAGVDLAPQALAYCRRRGHGGVRQGSVLDLPFADRSFDLVHSGDVLQHLPAAAGPQRALAESFRVLRPGGLLFVRTNAARRGEQPAEDYQRFDREGLRRRVEQAGFDVLAHSPVNWLPSLLADVRRGEAAHHAHGAGDRDTGLAVRLHPPHLAWLNAALLLVLRAEAWYVAALGRPLPSGHTQVCLARRPAEARTE